MNSPLDIQVRDLGRTRYQEVFGAMQAMPRHLGEVAGATAQ